MFCGSSICSPDDVIFTCGVFSSNAIHAMPITVLLSEAIINYHLINTCPGGGGGLSIMDRDAEDKPEYAYV